jgi:hypothetical protein
LCLPATTCAERPLPQPVNEPFIEAIVERIRDVVSRQSPDALDAFAATLVVAPEEFRALINHREHQIDALFLVDVVSAFVHEFAVDPEWLLTGHYNAATHREALILGEDRTAAGAYALRQFVRERYEKLRGTSSYLSPTLSKSIR